MTCKSRSMTSNSTSTRSSHTAPRRLPSGGRAWPTRSRPGSSTKPKGGNPMADVTVTFDKDDLIDTLKMLIKVVPVKDQRVLGRALMTHAEAHDGYLDH